MDPFYLEPDSCLSLISLLFPFSSQKWEYSYAMSAMPRYQVIECTYTLYIIFFLETLMESMSQTEYMPVKLRYKSWRTLWWQPILSTYIDPEQLDEWINGIGLVWMPRGIVSASYAALLCLATVQQSNTGRVGARRWCQVARPWLWPLISLVGLPRAGSFEYFKETDLYLWARKLSMWCRGKSGSDTLLH